MSFLSQNAQQPHRNNKLFQTLLQFVNPASRPQDKLVERLGRDPLLQSWLEPATEPFVKSIAEMNEMDVPHSPAEDGESYSYAQPTIPKLAEGEHPLLAAPMWAAYTQHKEVAANPPQMDWTLHYTLLALSSQDPLVTPIV